MAKVRLSEIDGKELIEVVQDGGQSIAKFIPTNETRDSILKIAEKLAKSGFEKFEDDGLDYAKPKTRVKKNNKK